MKEISNKEEEFFSKWEKTRKNKWQYILLHGPVYYGLPLGVILFLVISYIEIGELHLLKLPVYLLISGIIGLEFGYSKFKRTDKLFVEINEEDIILTGIQKLKSGQAWNYENLRIFKDESESLVVRNELFWFEDQEVSPEKLNDLFKITRSDFYRLKKNKAFAEYSENTNVKVQLFDNSANQQPLLEKPI
ncbi:hypothetical protein [Carboxylicivirga sp. RSCT41]|uniref:hypothetical protein n=1 Tax=Carboxylicivirga agarovorans TaxID=3417570 RepID=UPI003D343227